MVGYHSNIPSRLRLKGCVALLREIERAINGIESIREINKKDKTIFQGDARIFKAVSHRVQNGFTPSWHTHTQLQRGKDFEGDTLDRSRSTFRG